MTTTPAHILCRLRLHRWRYSHRRLRGGVGVMFYRHCPDCGARQKCRIVTVQDVCRWVPVNVA